MKTTQNVLFNLFTVLAIVTLTGLSGLAQQADQPPRLGVELGCRKIERLDPMKRITFATCMQQEVEGLTKLREQWPHFHDMTKSAASA